MLLQQQASKYNYHHHNNKTVMIDLFACQAYYHDCQTVQMTTAKPTMAIHKVVHISIIKIIIYIFFGWLVTASSFYYHQHQVKSSNSVRRTFSMCSGETSCVQQRGWQDTKTTPRKSQVQEQRDSVLII